MVKGTGQASRSVGSQVLGRADHACKHLGLKAGTLFPMPKAIAILKSVKVHLCC